MSWPFETSEPRITAPGFGSDEFAAAQDVVADAVIEVAEDL